MELAIGIDIGGTKTKIGLVTPQGKLLTSKTFVTSAGDPAQLTEDLLKATAALLKGKKNIRGIGLASAGRINFNQQKISYATDNLRGWTGQPIAERLQQAFNLTVRIDNDVNAALLTDLKLNPAWQHQIVIFICIGTGLGGAVSFNGKIIRGKTGSAGEFGHMTLYPGGHPCNCGKNGCAEQYISGRAYQRILGEKFKQGKIDLPSQDLTPATIQQRIFRGEKIYLATLRELAANLALLLENIKNCLDFDTCILGGSFTTYQDIILETIAAKFQIYNHKYWQKPLFTFSQQGNNSGVIGGGLLVFEDISPI